MIIYIDESGNLGFTFDKPGTTRYLIITALVCNNTHVSQRIGLAIKRTRVHENKRNKKSTLTELKGAKTSLAIKQYFFKQFCHVDGWMLYSIIVNKEKWLKRHKGKLLADKFYDVIFIKLLSIIPFPSDNITLIIDRSKTHRAIELLNKRIRTNFHKSHKQLMIKHDSSEQHPGLQAADLFCWGVGRKYEYAQQEWYELFKHKIGVELLI